MKEAELHNLWRTKKIGPLNLQSTDNQSISIIHYGFYNECLAGPDFSMGIINIEGIEEVGSIEMHIKSSDWYLHRHQYDSKYNNVILHVVLNDDKPVIQKGRKIPTIEVKDMVPMIVSQTKPTINFKNNLPCGAHLHDVPFDVTQKTKQLALQQKYDHKLVQIGATSYRREVLYKLVACAFGAPINQDQFLQLTDKAPVSAMLNLSQIQIKTKIIEESRLFDLGDQKEINWNFKGVRPLNFPTIRVIQFAEFVARLLFDNTFLKATEDLDLKTIKFKIEEVNTNLNRGFISKGMTDQLIINAFLPYYYYLNEKKRVGRIIETLKEMKPEKNTSSLYWANNGMTLSNAFDSQSLNALSKYNCQFKKCLSCDVGQYIFNSFT